MRKIAALAVTMLVLSIAAVAYAQQQQTNTYSVNASTSPTRAGSAKRPVPVSVNFGYTVGEESNLRPAPVRKYAIKLSGVRVNTNRFPSCSASQLQERGTRGCAAARVGRGFVENIAGGTSDPADKSARCNLQLTVFNTRNNRALLLLEGGPGETDARRQCPLPFGAQNGSGIIEANYVRTRTGTTLEFDVPQNLRHPIASIDNAVISTTSKIDRRVRRVRGRTIGYYESVGGCRNRRRTVTVTFTPETGLPRRASTFARCRS